MNDIYFLSTEIMRIDLSWSNFIKMSLNCFLNVYEISFSFYLSFYFFYLVLNENESGNDSFLIYFDDDRDVYCCFSFSFSPSVFQHLNLYLLLLLIHRPLHQIYFLSSFLLQVFLLLLPLHYYPVLIIPFKNKSNKTNYFWV